jgi:hypothetical protein
VEHPCPKCGTAVADGLPFCRQCNAPQIRVAILEPEPAPTASNPENLQWEPSQSPLAVRLSAIEWSHGIRAATLAGVASALMLITPVGTFGLGMLAGGFLAVVLYKKSTPGADPRPGAGAILGTVSGGIGFLLWGIMMAGRVVILRTGAELRVQMIHAIDQAASRSADPQAQAAANWLKSPPGFALMLALTLLFTLIVFLILSGIGGAVAAAVLRRREKLR